MWQDSTLNQPVASGAELITLLTADFTNPRDTQGFTVVRTLFCYQLSPTTPGVVSGQQRVSIGIGVASEEAFNAAVVPNPSVASEEPTLGWIYRCIHLVVDETLATGKPEVVRVDRDIRASRKIDSGKLYLVWENEAVEGSTFSVRLSGMLRCLIKLP